MILLDTGPIVALFDPRDDAHDQARDVLSRIREPLIVTTPVLTEAFHLLDPGSRGARALRQFVGRAGAVPWFMNDGSLRRALELMEQYGDQRMDFADASFVAAAEALRTTRIFSLDRRDFSSYRARIGRSYRAFRLVV